MTGWALYVVGVGLLTLAAWLEYGLAGGAMTLGVAVLWAAMMVVAPRPGA